MKKSCLVLILLTGLAVAPAGAGPFSIVLDSPVQTGAAGSILHFFGTITNTTGSTEYLNSDNFSLTGFTLATDVLDNFGNTPLSLGSGASSGDIDLFDITIPNPFTNGCVALLNCGGTYQIYGGADGNANSLLGTANFTVNLPQPSGVPEPSSFSMIALAGALFAAFGRRTIRGLGATQKFVVNSFSSREAKIETRRG